MTDSLIMMSKEIKDKWIAALRSGEYKQGIGSLKTADGAYCCLGVLEMVCDGKVESDKEYIGKVESDKEYIDLVEPIPTDMWLSTHWITMDMPAITTLTAMNDGHNNNIPKRDFNGIADYLEKNIEEVECPA